MWPPFMPLMTIGDGGNDVVENGWGETRNKTSVRITIADNCSVRGAAVTCNALQGSFSAQPVWIRRRFKLIHSTNLLPLPREQLIAFR